MVSSSNFINQKLEHVDLNHFHIFRVIKILPIKSFHDVAATFSFSFGRICLVRITNKKACYLNTRYADALHEFIQYEIFIGFSLQEFGGRGGGSSCMHVVIWWCGNKQIKVYLKKKNILQVETKRWNARHTTTRERKGFLRGNVKNVQTGEPEMLAGARNMMLH